MRSIVVSVAFLVVFGACSSYSPNLPQAPFTCGDTDPRCPDGYTCMMTGSGSGGVCVAPMGMIPVDGSMSLCADDSAIEGPNGNNTIATAYQTPVDTSKTTIPYSGLAICPAGDKDYYGIALSHANESLDVKITYEDWGGPLQLSVQLPSGVAVAVGGPVPGQHNTLHAVVENLSAGMYYAEVFGPSGGGMQENNYKMTISACLTTTDPQCQQ